VTLEEVVGATLQVRVASVHRPIPVVQVQSQVQSAALCTLLLLMNQLPLFLPALASCTSVSDSAYPTKMRDSCSCRARDADAVNVAVGVNEGVRGGDVGVGNPRCPFQHYLSPVGPGHSPFATTENLQTVL
jgi:hypothetical protein